MSQIVTVSEELYARLADAAHRRGFGSIEQFLESLPSDDDLRQREETVRRIKQMRGQLAAKYGKMRDSAELVREDRDR